MDGKQRILLVEDEPSLVEVLSIRLQRAGYEVDAAMDGQQALDQVNRVKPDLIILDLMLPKVNGYEVCTILKQDGRFGHIPIIMFTALTQEKDERLGFECGADAYVHKPIKSEQLLEKIRGLLAAVRTDDEQPSP